MRVCVLSTSFPRWRGDEASVFVGRLVQAFSDVGMSGIVVTPLDDGEKKREKWDGFEILRFKYGLFSKGSLAYGRGILPNLKNNPFLLFQIPGLLFMMLLTAYRQRERWDVIHANWVVSGCVAYLLSVLTSKPFVVTIRGEDAKLLTLPVIGSIFRYVLKRASAVVSVNEAFLSSLPSGATCIPNGAEYREVVESELQEFLDRKQLGRSDKYLLFVGRLIPLKRIEKLIDMVATPHLSNYTLLLVGRIDSEYGEALREQVRDLGVTDRVRFEGSTPYSEIASYLTLSNVYLSASSHEGRSNSMLEALAAGLPVVASDIEGHAELITHGDNGILFSEDESAEEVARKVSDLLSDLEKYTLLSTKCRESVKGMSWKSSAESYKELFRRVG